MGSSLPKNYLVPFWASALIASVLATYHILRYNYFDLYLFNKVAASTAIILLGVVLLLGPLTRVYQFFDTWLKYRKFLGMTAFVWISTHVGITYFLLPHIFLHKNLTVENLPFIFGFISFLIITVLFIYSLDLFVKNFERSRWWKMQYWGIRIGTLFGFLHYVVMKYPQWSDWLQYGGTSEIYRSYLPPESFLVGLFGLLVLCVRLSDALGKKIAQILTPVILIVLILIGAGMFILGIVQASSDVRRVIEPVSIDSSGLRI